MGASYADDVAWMGTLPYSWETDDVTVVHAARIPGVALADTPDDVLCGTTSGTRRLEQRLGGARWHELYADPKPVVFGHHVVGPEPLVREGRVYGIDTGACHGMRLTALLLPSFELVSVPARADHWRATKRAWQVPVLRERDRAGMSFEQLDKKGDGPRRRRRSRVIASLAETHGHAFPRFATAHPAGTVLIRRRDGRLSDDHLGCAGPGDVLRLARQLGVPLDLEVP